MCPDEASHVGIAPRIVGGADRVERGTRTEARHSRVDHARLRRAGLDQRHRCKHDGDRHREGAAGQSASDGGDQPGAANFARQIRDVIDQLDQPQKQHLLRLLIEDVHVTGWQVKIRLRIPLDPPDPGPLRPGPTDPAQGLNRLRDPSPCLG